jgi:hypothetical protein
MKEFFVKGLSGRKIEPGEFIEPEQDEQSSAARKMFWKRQLHSWLPHLQYVVVMDIEVPINQVGHN